MIKQIRILHVLGKLNRGGAETMVMNLYRKIDRSRIQFDFVVHTGEACDYDEEIKALGGRIHRFPRYTGVNHIEYVKSWNSFFEVNTEYRIIHGHVRSTAAIYLMIANKFGLKTIAHSHSTSSGSGISGLVKSILQFPIRYKADYLMACSSQAGKWLFGANSIVKDNYFELKNAITCTNFIFNDNLRKKKRNELKVGNKLVIGHVGRYHISKNHIKLIEIFNEIHKINNDVVLLLVGDGDLRGVIEEKVSKLGLTDSVIFTGSIKNVSDLYQVMDVFVLPSLYEGLGIVAIEAQAAGLPCIVSNEVPHEAFVTELVTTCDLSYSNQYWANVILSRVDMYKRRDMSDEIKAGGYDIGETSVWLSNFYCEIISS